MRQHWGRRTRFQSAKANGTGSLFDFDAPFPVEKIGKLIRLASSSEDHEALGAVRALGRLLKDHGGFHRLADVVTRNLGDPVVVSIKPKQPPPPPPPPKPLRPWQACAEELLRHPEILIKSDIIDEFDFLVNMSKAKYCPSAKQESWMNDIFRRPPKSQRQAS